MSMEGHPAIGYPCRECEAAANSPCVGKKGRAMKNLHRDRLRTWDPGPGPLLLDNPKLAHKIVDAMAEAHKFGDKLKKMTPNQMLQTIKNMLPSEDE